MNKENTFKTPHIIGIKNMSEEYIQSILDEAFKIKQNPLKSQ